MDKLRECPFCGNEGDIAEGQTFGFARQFQPCCRHCGLTLDIYDTLEQAISAWNARAEQPNEPLTLDELKQMKGEQVYVTRLEAGKERQNTIGCGWYEVRDEHLYSISKAIYFEVIENFFGWRAYRHKPKEDD